MISAKAHFAHCDKRRNICAANKNGICVDNGCLEQHPSRKALQSWRQPAAGATHWRSVAALPPFADFVCYSSSRRQLTRIRLGLCFTCRPAALAWPSMQSTSVTLVQSCRMRAASSAPPCVAGMECVAPRSRTSPLRLPPSLTWTVRTAIAWHAEHQASGYRRPSALGIQGATDCCDNNYLALLIADSTFSDKHTFASYANWLVPDQLLIGRYPFIDASNCK